MIRKEEKMTDQISYSPEVRERAVRLVFEQQKEYGSQWPAIKSIASKIGCTAETDRGIRGGMSTSDYERLKQLERENRELKRANEILRKAPAGRTCAPRIKAKSIAARTRTTTLPATPPTKSTPPDWSKSPRS